METFNEHEGVQALEHLAAAIRDFTKERKRALTPKYLERLERTEAPPLEPAG